METEKDERTAQEEAPFGRPPFSPAGATPDAVVEALLFVSSEPLKPSRLAAAAGCDEAAVREALSRLARHYDETGRAFQLVEIARGFQIMTRPGFGEVIREFKSARAKEKLSPSALETLAIVAYKQPIIRAEIEAVRGVGCGPVLRGLLERKLIRVAGRDKRAGNPILYRTTDRFLEHFGLKSLKDLPSIEDLKSPAV